MNFEISDSIARQFAGGIFVDEIKKYIAAHSDEYHRFLKEAGLLTSNPNKKTKIKEQKNYGN